MVNAKSITEAISRFFRPAPRNDHLYARISRTDIERLPGSDFLVLTRVLSVANVTTHGLTWTPGRAGLWGPIHKSTINRSILRLSGRGRLVRTGRRSVRTCSEPAGRPVRLSFLRNIIDKDSALVGRFLMFLAWSRRPLDRINLRELRAALRISYRQAAVLLAWLRPALAGGLRRSKLRRLVFRSTRAWSWLGDHAGRQQSPGSARSRIAPISSPGLDLRSGSLRSLTGTARAAPSGSRKGADGGGRTVGQDFIASVAATIGCLPDCGPARSITRLDPVTLRRFGAGVNSGPARGSSSAATGVPESTRRHVAVAVGRGPAGPRPAQSQIVRLSAGQRAGDQGADPRPGGSADPPTEDLSDLSIADQLRRTISPHVLSSPRWRSFFLSQK
jgi:hypothetical protein